MLLDAVEGEQDRQQLGGLRPDEVARPGHGQQSRAWILLNAPPAHRRRDPVRIVYGAVDSHELGLHVDRLWGGGRRGWGGSTGLGGRLQPSANVIILRVMRLKNNNAISALSRMRMVLKRLLQ